MAGNIDHKFISDLEGGSKTSGYVPAAEVSKSGVTIATGFDLGQRGDADLKALSFSDDLIAKLKPFLGKTGKEAQQALEKSPLTVTPEQASEIDKAVKKNHVEQITLKYDTVAKNSKKFFELPAEAQTAITSVSFQYGANLATATPKFWEAAIAQDWKECTKLLKNFGDAYPTRRKKEAALLEAIK